MAREGICSRLNGFASPFEALDIEFAEIIAISHARAVCSRFLDCYEVIAGLEGSGLELVLRRWLETKTQFDVAWDIAFGDVKRAFRLNNPHAARRAALALGIWITSHVYCGPWQSPLSRYERTRWGAFLLPPADHIAVSLERNKIIVILSLGKTNWKFGLDCDGTLFPSSHDGCLSIEQLPQLGLSPRGLIVLPPAYLTRVEFDDVRQSIVNELTGDLIANGQAGLDLLSEYAPEYLEWVLRLASIVVPFRVESDVVFSGSYENRPGTIGLSLSPNPLIVAELLVHEGTHQYYYLLSKYGAVQDGSDTNLYYSPIKNLTRPIELILLSYHAFANVAIFYKMCLMRGVGYGKYARDSLTELLLQLRVLEGYLRSTSALTDLGNALWQPLAERLH